MSKCPADFNFFDQQVLNCPYEFYRTLQEQAPVYHLPGTNIYMVTRYADIKRLLKDTEVCVSTVIAPATVVTVVMFSFCVIKKEPGSKPPTPSLHSISKPVVSKQDIFFYILKRGFFTTPKFLLYFPRL